MVKIVNQNDQKGKATFPAQPQPNPKGIDANYTTNTCHEQVKVITTLRSGRVFDNQIEPPPPEYVQVRRIYGEDTNIEAKHQVSNEARRDVEIAKEAKS